MGRVEAGRKQGSSLSQTGEIRTKLQTNPRRTRTLPKLNDRRDHRNHRRSTCPKERRTRKSPNNIVYSSNLRRAALASHTENDHQNVLISPKRITMTLPRQF